MTRNWRTEEINKKQKVILLKRNGKPYLGCLVSDELDLEREGKKKRKKEKRRVIKTHGKREGFFPLFATI